MYVGQLVEMADTDELYHNPRHPYTEALLSGRARATPGARRNRIVLEGEVASPANPPPGATSTPGAGLPGPVLAGGPGVARDQPRAPRVVPFLGEIALRGDRVIADQPPA